MQNSVPLLEWLLLTAAVNYYLDYRHFPKGLIARLRPLKVVFLLLSLKETYFLTREMPKMSSLNPTKYILIFT